jgi:pilus assembly protein FimV
MAVYEENPHAFYKENVNGLLTGKILKIPEKDIVVKLSRKQALAEFNRQTQAWKNSSEQVSVEPGSAKKETLDNKLTLAAPKEPDIAKNRINAPENEQLAAKNKVDKVELKFIDKGIVSPVNDALQDKVAELEKQLAMMQQILALKDQQLAVLQNQISPKPAIQTTTGQAEVVNPAPKKQVGQLNSKSAIRSESKGDESSKIKYLLFGSVILPLLGWLWWRKRKSTDNHNLFAASGIDEPFESKNEFSTSAEKNTSKKDDSDIKRPIFSEITFGDFQASDTEQDEIDPVSEADVYLAYGRYQQAEELLRDAIKNQPNRDEIKLKLLNIFYTNKDNQAFETYVNELAKAGKNDDLEFWGKVTEMGRDICKDSPMFSSEEDGFSPEEKLIVQQLAVKSNELGDSKNESIDFVSSAIATKIEESSDTLDSLVFEAPVLKLDDEFESFDFEFGLSETDIKAIDKIDNSDVKKPIENDQLVDTLSKKSPSSNNKFGNDFLNRDFYIDKHESEVNRDVFDLTDMDEFETKLDLAKAYIDMSNTDTAKEIVCEILEKGTADQKKIAQALLNDLN